MSFGRSKNPLELIGTCECGCYSTLYRWRRTEYLCLICRKWVAEAWRHATDHVKSQRKQPVADRALHLHVALQPEKTLPRRMTNEEYLEFTKTFIANFIRER